MTVRVRTNGTGHTGQDMGGYTELSAGLRNGAQMSRVVAHVAEWCGTLRKVARVARVSIELRIQEDSDEVDVEIGGYEPVEISLSTPPICGVPAGMLAAG